MHGVTSKTPNSTVELGPVVTAEVLLEGESVSALVDTGSPVTIVSLECIVKTLARKRCPEQSPAQWRREVEKRLEPPTLPLRSYGGNELNLVKQIQVTLSRAGFSVTSVVQVHGGALVDLLLGTDLLPHLGFSMVAKSPDGSTLDLLQKQTRTDRNPGEHTPVVCLIQATKLPPLHQKMVRAKVHNLAGQKGMMLFEPEMGFTDENGVQVAEAALEVSEEQEVTLILQNYRKEPVELAEVRILGSAEPVPSGLVTEAEQQVKIVDALGLDRTDLTSAECEQLKAAVIAYADLFALSPFELGVTDLVSHSVDTGDHTPVRQPARRTPFSLRQNVTEMVQQMLKQGVVCPSHSPWASPIVLVQKKDGSLRFCIN